MAHQIQPHTIKELFTRDSYRIPIYQRNYAWGKREISQLIHDIIDYVQEQRNYYIGTLIVFEQASEHGVFYDTIDGQQRLTTFSILLSVLKNEFSVMDWYQGNTLTFESRPLSQNALECSYAGYFSGYKEYHSSIKDAYDHIKQELGIKLKESGTTIEDFARYVTNHVVILRVQVPYDTDLNHYFEIMNNRGEQLEKHEVVKSLLLDVLYDGESEENDCLQELFHSIWDAAQQMERYIQFGFEPKLRRLLFGKDWSELQPKECAELLEIFYSYKEKSKDGSAGFSLGIDAIINSGQRFEKIETTQDTPDRFTSPVNFQNFLLHLLKIQTSKNEVALDDKRLIDLFKAELKNRDREKAKAFVLEFMFNLLRGKWLFDTYVIKRQFLSNKEGWSLMKLRSSDGVKGYYVNTFGKESNWDNEYVITLLSMFHTAAPAMIYKYWLNAAMYHLLNSEEVSRDDYVDYLEKIAKDLICFRFLNEDEGSKLDYHALIFKNHTIPKKYPVIQYDNLLLQYGSIENNLVFNFLDYIIWDSLDDEVAESFEFSFRSSVEHYYPQNPIGGQKLEDQYSLHSFGNLCLISHQKNSKLNHHLPSAKKNYYAKLNQGGHLAYDSLKQYIMMRDYNAEEWSMEQIDDHHRKMVDLINNFIQAR